MTPTKTKSKSKYRAVKITAIVIAAVLVVLFAAATVIVSINMDKKFGRADYYPEESSVEYLYSHYESEYPRENVTFTSCGNTLQAYIYGSDNDKGLLVFAHGISSGHERYLNTLMWFVDNGWRVFTYDATGSGYSGGEGTKGLPQSALDLDAALDYIEADPELSALPRFLMGHSWGGYAVTAVLNFGHEVDGVASISGYAEPVEMIYEFAKGVVGGARPLLYPSIWLYNKMLFGEYAGLSAVDGINATDAPILIIHGTEDETIGYTESAIINKRGDITNPNVQYITLDGCTHRGMFDTPEGGAVKQEINEKLAAIAKEAGYKHTSDLLPDPSDEVKAVFSAADLDAVNEPNVEFLSQIEDFFNEILEQNGADGEAA